MQSQPNTIFVTHVEKEGPFLKVWGQTERNIASFIGQVLQNFSINFDNGIAIPLPETLQLGALCCAKYKDNKYYRTRITSLNYLHNKYIEVNFIDYGHQDVVPVSNIRSLEGLDSAFVSIPAQAHCFILAEAVCATGEWTDVYLEEICKEIKYTNLQFSVIAQVTKHYLVKLFIASNDLGIILISRGLMRQTSLTTQEAVLLSMMPRTMAAPQQQQAAQQQNIATYKAFSLEPGSQYEVYVSYVTDGPCNFSIQLKQSEEVLGKLMKEINSMNLTPLDGVPLPGTVCLARCIEDGHICRAVVTNEVDGQFKVFYVDFGNYEVVPMDVLYEIPFKFVIPKVMAIRFALEGVEKSTVTLEMQCAFKEYVDNRLIFMKVMPSNTRTALPRCELWDPETQISALDIVNQAASAAYPSHISLNRGFAQSIKVSFVYGCNRFFVQLQSKQEELTRLMMDLQLICKDSDVLPPDQIKVGLPCYALFEADYQWYRSQIVEVSSAAQVKVHYVDYGNEEVVASSALKHIEGKQLTILRPQAIECCLNGYQNMGPDRERDSLLEELILEQEFTMKVVEMQGKKALIELIDSANYNVASLLLDKIASTRSQVSPMLVQAGNKIEHRKSVTYGAPRDHPFAKQQEKFDRSKSVDSEGSTENSSWRQNNRGFSKNSERYNRDDINDSNENDKEFNKGFRSNSRNRDDFSSRNGDGNHFKQHNKGFNDKRDRPPRDNNRNNEWGDRDGDKRFSPRGDGDKGFSPRGDGDKGFSPRDKTFNSKGGDDWGGSGNDQKSSRDTNDWSNNKKTFNSRDRDNRSSHRDGDKKYFKSDSGGQGGWDTSESKPGKSFRDNREDGKGFSPREKDNFTSTRERINGEADSWNNSESSHKQGGFKKKSDFKREGSEVSSSGSEKSFRKGFRDRDNSKQNRPKNKFGDNVDSWNTPSATEVEVSDPAANTDCFAVMDLDQTEATVKISWFHNPGRFYILLEQKQVEFKQLMEDIQQTYKDKKCGIPVVGAPVIGLFPEDKVLYRAQVLEVTGSQYKVLYVDFGNISVIDKVWPIEKRFMNLPAQAVCCKLAEVEAPAGNWPGATSYAQYFDRMSFTCQFYRQEGDRFNVKLAYNNEDIGEQLVTAGLAQAVAPPKPVELPLLIGQQFRAMLLSVNTLSDFAVCLQNGVALTCSVFNVENSTETFEDNLRDKIGQILILYVDNADEKLQATPYDTDGLKIKLIDQDEEAFETVEIICPHLISYSILSGEVTHSEDSTIYIQPSDCVQNIEYLLNALFEYFDATTLESPIVPVEGYVYAVKGSDANWYRGRVTSLEESTCVVNFIDYGNSESVEFTALRELTAEFMEISVLCVPVLLTAPTVDLVGTRITVSVEFTETGLQGTVQEEVIPETVQEEVIPETVQEEVIQELVVEPEPIQITDAAQVESCQPSSEASQIPGIQVVLSHVDSPSDFYLHLFDHLTAIDELQATLQEQVAEMPDLENPAVGVLCAAPYSADQQWYRAQVLDADSDITTVRFVDYGNTDVLDNKTTHVKTLSSSFLALEVHATRCRLKIKPVDEEWTAAASERFEKLGNVDFLSAEFISQDEKTNYVELFSNGVNVRKILTSENLALPDEVFPESNSVGFVSHLNSPSEFWIQLENCVDELEWVAEQLSAAESFKELEDLAPGTLCAALFPDDQMWYRARILSNTVAGIEALFVDYGNSCTCCSLRELPEDLVMLPPLAQKCSLQKPVGLSNWGPEMLRKFHELSADGQTTFEVKKLTTGETALVELLLDGADVTKMLLPQTEDVLVKSFDDLDNLVLVKDENELENKFKLENLQDVVWNDESIKIFSGLCGEGKKIFQAEFVSEDTVRLYRGLNDIRLDLNGTKTATPTSSPLKTRSERHSSEIESVSINDIKEIIRDIVDQSVDLVSVDVVQSIVDDMVEKSTTEVAHHESSDDTVNEPTSLNTSNNSAAEAAATIIDGIVAGVVDKPNLEQYATATTDVGKSTECGDISLNSSNNSAVDAAESIIEGIVTEAVTNMAENTHKHVSEIVDTSQVVLSTSEIKEADVSGDVLSNVGVPNNSLESGCKDISEISEGSFGSKIEDTSGDSLLIEPRLDTSVDSESIDLNRDVKVFGQSDSKVCDSGDKDIDIVSDKKRDDSHDVKIVHITSSDSS